MGMKKVPQKEFLIEVLEFGYRFATIEKALLLNLHLNSIYSHSSARSQIPNLWSAQSIWESPKVRVSAAGDPPEYKNGCLWDRFQAQPWYTMECKKIRCLNAYISQHPRLLEQQKAPRREYVWQTHNRSQLLHMENWDINKVFNYCWLKLLGRARHLIPEFSPRDFTKSVKSASQEDTFHLCVFVCYFRYLVLRECKWPANPERDSTKLSTRSSRLCHLYWLKLLKVVP